MASILIELTADKVRETPDVYSLPYRRPILREVPVEYKTVDLIADKFFKSRFVYLRDAKKRFHS